MGVCELPVGLAGVPGVLEVTVVAEDVPLLIPISLLKALGAVINIPKSTIQFLRVQADTVMHSFEFRTPGNQCHGIWFQGMAVP